MIKKFLIQQEKATEKFSRRWRFLRSSGGGYAAVSSQFHIVFPKATAMPNFSAIDIILAEFHDLVSKKGLKS